VLTLCAVTDTGLSKVAVLGASRGIGCEIAKIFSETSRLFLVSRKWQPIHFPNQQKFSSDLAQPDEWPKLLEALSKFSPDRIFYVAGGGPHGDFKKKEWKDHLWAYNLNLLAPAFFIHAALGGKLGSTLNQFIVFGSAVAESEVDLGAASYSSCKHGILGLVKNLNAENPNFDLRLYSPGYTDTDLIPKVEKPRLALCTPQQVAKDVLLWSQSGEGEKHRIYNPFAAKRV
jgi:short-subunit dehydrogenase